MCRALLGNFALLNQAILTVNALTYRWNFRVFESKTSSARVFQQDEEPHSRNGQAHPASHSSTTGTFYLYYLTLPTCFLRYT
ncbi:hypothetical protein F5Y07DRAFT_351299 [Xylaria sp. FL0933]|nr:hypothetical protein F5Y07DRAFT_351299 [Xylaria sp. FL0933]